MRNRIEVETKPAKVLNCRNCKRQLNGNNELMDAHGVGLGWCGFCRPNREEREAHAKTSGERRLLNFGRELTMKVGATASRSFRKSIEPIESQLRAAAEEHAEKLTEWPAFTRETFARLYDERNLKPLPNGEASSWGGQAVGTLERQPEWSTMREAAQAHRGIASKTSARLSRAVATAMGIDKLPEDGTGSHDPRDMEAMRESLRDLLGDQDLSPEEIESHPAMTEIVEQEAESDAIRQALGGKLESATRRGELRRAMQSIAKDAKAQADAARALSGMGIGSEEGSSGTESVPMDLIEKISGDPLMLKILDEIGRMQRAFNTQSMSSVGEGSCDVIGVRPDDKISRLLPSERAKLIRSKHSRLELISRVMEKRAVCWELEGEEPREKGDLVLCVDRSGSMSGDLMVWARAVAGAMVLMAVKKSRRVALVMFDHEAEGTLIDSPSKLAAGFECLSLEASGGTNINRALRCAVDMTPELREPDVMIISDGCFRMDDKYAELAKEKGGRLFAVMLGGAHLQDERFNRVWTPNLADGDAVEILSEVVR